MKTKLFTALIISLVVVLGGFYLFKEEVSAPLDETIDKTSPLEQNSPKEDKPAVEAELIKENGSIMEEAQNEDLTGIPVPDLDRRTDFTTSLPKDALDITINKINSLSKSLKANPSNFQFWIDLGLNRKMINDYVGAKEAWEYASLLRPQNSVSFSNLGDLYHYYTKDYEKAEKNLKKAIENKPDYAIYYKNLSDLYKFSYKTDTDLAEQTLLDGLKANPNLVDMSVFLASYYKEVGNREKAIFYYKKASDEAKKLGNSELAGSLDQEILLLSK